MTQYDLKDKILVSSDFIADLESRSWQEIEILQSQITNIDLDSNGALELVQLLKNLLTSYYVFTGELENLVINLKDNNLIKKPIAVDQEINKNLSKDINTIVGDSYKQTSSETTDFEPFEYFVDFEEPSGEPISDEDLYSQ